jgi:hypothetical protein
MAIFKRREKRADRPHERMFYRDYLASTFWQLRKRRYFSKYGKRCRICGEGDGVELDHVTHGDYGHERDSDLVALCAAHHKKLEALIHEEGADVDRLSFIATETALFESQKVDEAVEPRYEYSPSLFLNIHMTLDMIARPIWRILYGLLPW